MLPWYQNIKGQNIEGIRINPADGFWRQLETALVSVWLPFGENFNFNFQEKARFHKRIKASFARLWFERGLAKQLDTARRDVANKFLAANKAQPSAPKGFEQRLEVMTSRHRKWTLKFGSEYEVFFNQALAKEHRAEIAGGFAADLEMIFEPGLKPMTRRLLVSMHVEAFYTMLSVQEEFIKRLASGKKLTFAEKMHLKSFTAHQLKVVDGYETGLQLLLSQVNVDKLSASEITALQEKIFVQTQKVTKYVASAKGELRNLNSRKKSVKALHPATYTGSFAGLRSSCSQAFSGGVGKVMLEFAKTAAYGYTMIKAGKGIAWVILGDHDHDHGSSEDTHAHSHDH